jgi:hypothetical protein
VAAGGVVVVTIPVYGKCSLRKCDEYSVRRGLDSVLVNNQP